MTDELPRAIGAPEGVRVASEPASDEVDVRIDEEEATHPVPPVGPVAPVLGGGQAAPGYEALAAAAKRARPKMALRIPDDEVARPLSAPPPEPRAASRPEISPSRIITINPPPAPSSPPDAAHAPSFARGPSASRPAPAPPASPSETGASSPAAVRGSRPAPPPPAPHVTATAAIPPPRPERPEGIAPPPPSDPTLQMAVPAAVDAIESAPETIGERDPDEIDIDASLDSSNPPPPPEMATPIAGAVGPLPPIPTPPTPRRLEASAPVAPPSHRASAPAPAPAPAPPPSAAPVAAASHVSPSSPAASPASAAAAAPPPPAAPAPTASAGSMASSPAPMASAPPAAVAPAPSPSSPGASSGVGAPVSSGTPSRPPTLTLADDGVDIPVDEDEDVPPSDEPEVDVADLVSVESAAAAVAAAAAARPAASPSRPAPAPTTPAAPPTTPKKPLTTTGEVPVGVPGAMTTPSGGVQVRRPTATPPPPPPSPVVPIGMQSSPSLVSTSTPRGGVPALVPPDQQVPGRSPFVIVPPSSPLAPPPMSEAAMAAQRKKARPWWEELFNDDFIRTMSKITDDQIGAEADFIEDSLGVAKGAMILDLACGTGRHAIELTRRGYQVVGYDLSLPMLAKAAEEAQDRSQKINFLQGDMREMTFEETFDGIYCWNTSFGYFEEEKNAQVVVRVHKALRKGGQFLLDVVNRDYIMKQSPSLAWFEGEGCVCMDEMQVDWITSRMRVKRTMMMDDGRSKEIEYSVRVYALHELGKILHDNGFRVAEVSGRVATPGVFFGSDSPRTLILAEKR